MNGNLRHPYAVLLALSVTAGCTASTAETSANPATPPSATATDSASSSAASSSTVSNFDGLELERAGLHDDRVVPIGKRCERSVVNLRSDVWRAFE